MMNRRWLLALATGVVALILTAGSAGAQEVRGVQRGKFDVNIGGGVFLAPNASALVSAAPLINLTGRFFATENFGIGFSVDYTRTETDDDVFPLTQFAFSTADSTTFVALKQAVSIVNYEVIGTLGTGLAGGKFYPYLRGGVGGYTIYFDPQQTEGAGKASDWLFDVGVALKIGITQSSSIELMARDMIYTNFNRDSLNPTPDRTCAISGDKQFSGNVCPNERFPFLDPQFTNPNWPEPKSTIHNIVLTASFAFIPGL